MEVDAQVSGTGYGEQKLLGRHNELEELNRLWQLAKIGNPQWITIIGESGTGKTRLAQEFFRAISKADDPGNYWPDELPVDGESLSLNPPPAAFKRGDAEKDGDFPWLWWGVRSKELGGRNTGEATCAFLDAIEPFSIHIDPLVRQHARNKAAVDASKEVAGQLVSIATGGFSDPLLQIFTLVKKGLAVAKGAMPNPMAYEVGLDRSKSMQTLIVDSIFRYLATGVPVVLLLDDCHWLDNESVGIMSALINELGSQKLKLFIIATSWKREYENVQTHPLHALLARDASSGKPLVGSFLGDAHELKLGGLAENDANAVMLSLLPGLTTTDVAHVYARTGGNVRHIHEMCDYLGRQSQNFEQSDPRGSLSDRGRRQLESKDTSLDDLVDKRFCALPIQVQRALETSSFQGSRFDVGMTADVARIISEDDPAYLTSPVEELIATAERPGSMISTIDTETREFLPGPYWRVARKSLNEGISTKVDRSYAAMLPTLLSRPIASLSSSHIEFIASQSTTCTDEELTQQCYVTLAQAFSHTRRYEKALEQIARLAKADLSTLIRYGSDFAECGLEVVSYFGVRSPAKVAGESVDFGIWTLLLARAIYDDVRNSPLETLDEANLSRLARKLHAIAEAHDVLGEVLESKDAHAWLADFITEATKLPNRTFGERTAIEWVSHLGFALERCAPFLSAEPERLRAWIDAAEKLMESATSNITLRLLRGYIAIIELQSSPALLGREPNRSEVNAKYVRAANDIGEVLATRYRYPSNNHDAVALAFPAAQIVLASSTARVIEQALHHGESLAHDFIDIVKRMVVSISQSAEEGKYVSPPLFAGLVDSLIAASIFLEREAGSEHQPPAIPPELSKLFNVYTFEERVIGDAEGVNMSRACLKYAEHYYEAGKGSVEFLVARARSFVRALEADDELRLGSAEAFFLTILDDARVSEDGKREALQEPPQFKQWLEQIRSEWLFGESKKRATEEMEALYSYG